MRDRIKHFYQGIINIGDFLGNFLLLVLRLYWGYAFYKAGLGKLGNIENIASYFEVLHIPVPLLNAYLVAGFETVGGLMLIFGLAARVAAIPLAIIMITALFTAHSEATLNAITTPQKLINQTPFNFLLTSLIVFCFGPGSISIDYLFKRFVFKLR